MQLNKIYNENCLATMARMPDGFIDCCITSPPYYGLRDYGHADQIGLEETPDQYIENIVKVFREVKRVLKREGTFWLNLGDSYFSDTKGSGGTSDKQASNAGSRYNVRKFQRTGGLKPKDLIGIPWMVAFALRADGWYLRQDIIWHKPNPMPESVTDRCTKSHEYIFLMSKSQKYFYDAEAIKEKAAYDGRKDTLMKGSAKYATAVVPDQSAHTMAARGHERWKMNENGEHIRNKRSVWTITTKPYSGAHFATFPEELIIPMVKAGCPEKGIIYDPFGGAGTTALVSHKLNRRFILSEINSEYVQIAEKRIRPYLQQQMIEF